MSVFDGKKATGTTPQITINIAGINDPVISGEASDVEDVTYTDYEADNDES
jgi:VCBS repeat-containing protein